MPRLLTGEKDSLFNKRCIENDIIHPQKNETGPLCHIQTQNKDLNL